MKIKATKALYDYPNEKYNNFEIVSNFKKSSFEQVWNHD